MELHIDPDGLVYEPVRWHSKRKHAFMKAFFDIWADDVKNNQPTLAIFDLFASSGLCYCEDAERYGSSEPRWNGSAILAAECLDKYPMGKTLFLNTYNPKSANIILQAQNLERLMAKYTKFGKIITALEIHEALKVAQTHVDPRFPNIWILDPYAASTLPWDIVETIGHLQSEYSKKGKKVIRKPEMIITLMTYDLQINVNTNPHVVTAALGMPVTEWRPIYDHHIENGLNAREAIIEMYTDRLSEIYEKGPIIAEVRSTDESAIVYCMILCSDHNAGYYMMKMKKMPELEDWKIRWRQDAKMITAKKKLPNGQKGLDAFQ